ncbi:RNA polymerase sigma24 factor [Catellatospora sp. IY07-71]|uniref:RNA polymerase sigma factor n=1 Tax=Catellatospora sp. IY07-71 TaxID=2728827 RepID=UPI001BB41197|nr:SigE family RNA polymerase sigma factor [Catellatospora sp. IY07-71]BCJ71714.1 RNA polymerase sigma24 factor [Catellatospora sp. IY07-71]
MRDAESFDECYRGTSRRLLSYAYALTGDWAQAQDLVQEAYMRAWRQWGRLSEYEDVEAWLRLVVSRLATDVWRRLQRWRGAMRLLGPAPDAEPADESAVLLHRALRGLPAVQRQALALHYLFDMPVAQIAQDAGVPIGTVKSWLSRGRTSLAAVLDVKEVTGDE